MNIVIIALLLLIVLTLGQALYGIGRGQRPQRVARALSVRVGLSLLLFVLLLGGNLLGWWAPRGG